MQPRQRTAAIFDEASRSKTIDLGDGPFSVGEKASDVSTAAFDAMRQLKLLIDANGGSLPQPLTTAQRTACRPSPTNLNSARQTILVSQGRNGDLQNAGRRQIDGACRQSNALSKLQSEAADADLAEVATKISAFQVQYQAVAQTFSMLSHMSLLDYLSA